MFEPEYWTVCINGNRKEVRTVGMSTRLSIINTSARTGKLELFLRISSIVSVATLPTY